MYNFYDEFDLDEIIRGSDSDTIKAKKEQRLARERHKQYELIYGIERDKRGRLKAGSKLAHKGNIDEDLIWQYHCENVPAKEIAKNIGCSLSTVYRILEKVKRGETASI